MASAQGPAWPVRAERMSAAAPIARCRMAMVPSPQTEGNAPWRRIQLGAEIGRQDDSRQRGKLLAEPPCAPGRARRSANVSLSNPDVFNRPADRPLLMADTSHYRL